MGRMPKAHIKAESTPVTTTDTNAVIPNLGRDVGSLVCLSATNLGDVELVHDELGRASGELIVETASTSVVMGCLPVDMRPPRLGGALDHFLDQ